ncbi:MAG: class I SAM-dependent methyltransferase [Gammaproteobacteria bacterium]|nr:class I SAM-dependent methyltransferase [Gammaproteobacteria bacterium]
MAEMKILIFGQCPACNSYESEIVERNTESDSHWFLELSKRKYNGCMNDWQSLFPLDIHHCLSCSHLWYYRQPDQSSLVQMYNNGIVLNPVKIAKRPSWRMRKEMKTLYELVKHRYQDNKPRLLDFGSGRGLWAHAAQENGFEVTAYEPSAIRSTSGIRSDGFRLTNCLEDLGEQKFHAVNIEQVLEHLPQPVETLKAVLDYCLDKALIRITVPNIGREKTRPGFWNDFPFDGQHIHLMSPFEHLQGFTQNSLGCAARRAGLSPVRHIDLWLKYPAYSIRRLIGRTITRLSTTMIIAEPRK